MRVSSVMIPSFNGTLKSTRMKTRLRTRSRSRMESLAIAAALQAFLDHQPEQVDAAVRVAPLVVVPRENFHEVAVHHLRVRGVDDRRMRVALEIDRHQLFGRER